jgi:hypothetical protein
MGNITSDAKEVVLKGITAPIQLLTDTQNNVAAIIKDGETGIVRVITNGMEIYKDTEQNFFDTVQTGLKDLATVGIDVERNAAYDFKDLETRVFAVASSAQKNFFQELDLLVSGFYTTMQFFIAIWGSLFLVLAIMFGDVIVNTLLNRILAIIEAVVNKVHIG